MPKIKFSSKALQSNIFTAFGRGVFLGLTNFWRNKILSLATILVMAVILFIFNIILAVQSTAHSALQSLSDHVDIIVDLKNDIDLYKAQPFLNDLKTLKEVKKVTYISKEEALEKILKIHPPTVEFYKKWGLQNPLYPSISIVLKNPSDYKKVESFILESKYKSFLKNETNTSEENNSEKNNIISTVGKNLAQLNNFVKQMIFWIVFAFVSGGTLIIMNAIQLTIYTRRQEISIMRLVGATPGFIRLPFIFEGMLYSVFAILLSAVFLFGLSWSLNLEIIHPRMFADKLIWELLLTIFLGTLSSLSAVEHYLKKNISATS